MCVCVCIIYIYIYIYIMCICSHIHTYIHTRVYTKELEYSAPHPILLALFCTQLGLSSTTKPNLTPHITSTWSTSAWPSSCYLRASNVSTEISRPSSG